MTAPTPPAKWTPSPAVLERANLTALMKQLGLDHYDDLHRWSVDNRAEFWGKVVEQLGISFVTPPEELLDLRKGVEQPRWLRGARFNIVDSCFHAHPNQVAVVYRRNRAIHRMTYRRLRADVDRVANGFVSAGFSPGDRIAIAMPMTVESVVAYLGIVAAGGVVVSIADSFAADEIAARLRITNARTVITQDLIHRGGKDLPMYAKVAEAGAERAIVVETGAGLSLREGDVSWNDFLGGSRPFDPVPADPDDHINILFSSGTTGDPKAIPWTQLTPIKSAMDGRFHHDIHSDDLVAWPTNLGWMMGPWLIFATLINRAAMALYEDVPTDRSFGRFVADAGVTILGVVPSLVAAWRSTACMEGLDWRAIRLFSSTGEASNHDDMAYLMDLAGNKPIIEYCGGTETGGGYITGTVVQPVVPATFSTPTLGIDFRILDEAGGPASSGELFLVPPSIGLSTELLNRNHHEVYYEGTPETDEVLRRHGDHMEALEGGYYRAHGRIDDTMNLSGIKVGSAEIERALLGVSGLIETAAVAVEPPGGGPSRLVVFAVPKPGAVLEPETLRREMQEAIGSQLNPLFKVHDVVLVDALPRTASAKVMRRELRAYYAR